MRSISISIPLALVSGISLAQGRAPSTASPNPSASDAVSALNPGAPRIDFESFRVNLGELFRGQRAGGVFKFRNAGTGKLQIRSVHATCGCAEIKVEPKDEFAPGEEGRVRFEFDSSNFAAEVVRTITLDTNMPSPSSVTLTFTAHVSQEIASQPPLVDFGELFPEAERSVNLKVSLKQRAAGTDTPARGPGEAKLPQALRNALALAGETGARPKILRVDASNPALSAVLKDDSGSGDAYVAVTLKGPLPIGPLRERVTIWNTSRHLKELVVPIVAEVRGHVRPSEDYVEFGVVVPHKPIRRVVEFASDRPGFNIEGIDLRLKRTDALKAVGEKDLLQMETRKSAKGMSVELTLKVPPGLAPGTLTANASGEILVRTNDPDYREIRLPFFGVLRKEDSAP